MALEVAIFTSVAETRFGVVVPTMPWPDTLTEDAAWWTTWPLGRIAARDAFANGRAVTSALSSGEVAFFAQCDADTMAALLAIATTSWPGTAALAADNSATAQAVKAAWLGEELVIDGRIAGYLDVPTAVV